MTKTKKNDIQNGKIYMITCKTTGLRYIGQTVGTIEKRLSSHLRGTRQPKFKMSKLQKDMEKYGHLDFEIKLIEDEIKDIDELAKQEKYYIKKYGTLNEYNSSAGGESKLRSLEKASKHSVKINKLFFSFGFRSLNVIEQNLWWSIFNLIKEKGLQPLVLTRIDIIKLAEYDEVTLAPRDFIKSMENMYKKIISINTNQQKNGIQKDPLFNPFSTFKVNKDYIEIQVSKAFSSWFNEIKNNFIEVDLAVLIRIKSGYSKEIYRLLMSGVRVKRNNKYSRIWSIDIAQFRRLMCIPENYNMSDIKRRISNPSYEELTNINSDGIAPLNTLEVNLIVEKGAKKKVDRLEFSFTQNTSLKV